MAVFAYGRVGTKDPTAAEQRAGIERAGYMVDYWYADEGMSGRTPAADRPQWRRLLDQISDGETLVVSRLDRLGRDAVDVSTTVAALAARRIKVVIVELEQLDLTSAEGTLCSAMLFAMAEMERDLQVERAQAKGSRAKPEGTRLLRAAKPGAAGRTSMRAAIGAGRDS